MTVFSNSFARSKSGFILAASGTGLQVTASSGMTVAVAAGTYFLGGKTIVYGGANVTADTANPTNARYDVVVLNSAGTAFIVKGTAAASPTVPVFKDDVMPVAILVISANDATIASADIIDIRDFGGLTADGTTISVSAAGALSVVQSGLTQLSSVVASGSNTTSLVGNGTAQTVFTDTYTALASGDLAQIFITCNFARTAGAGTTDLTLSISGTTLDTHTMGTGTASIWRISLFRSATAARSRLVVEHMESGVTGTDAWNVVANTTFSGTAATLLLQANTAAATNGDYAYSYCVQKLATGV